MFPELEARDYHDDHLLDTLDALYKANLSDLRIAVTNATVSNFSIEVKEVHTDTTAYSLYGDYEDQPEEGLKIVRGHPKNYRRDLKQVVESVSVNQESIPLYNKAHNGNHIDGKENYISHWLAISETLKRTDFLYIGDCKLASEEQLITLASKGAKIVAPYPMTVYQKEQILKELETVSFSSCDDFPGYEFYESGIHFGEYTFRRLVIRSKEKIQHTRKVRLQQIEKTLKGLKDFKEHLNKYKWITKETIEKKLEQILSKYPIKEFFEVTLRKKKVTQRKYLKTGKPNNKTPYKLIGKEVFSLKFKVKEDLSTPLDGIFIIVSNTKKQDYPFEEIIQLHKNQWKCEKSFATLKGPLAVNPMWLHLPRRIEALLFVLDLALLILRLIARDVYKALEHKDKGPVGLYPNKRAPKRPDIWRVLRAFDNLNVVSVYKKGRLITRQLAKLTTLQSELLNLMSIRINDSS